MFPIYCFRTPLGIVALYPMTDKESLKDFEITKNEYVCSEKSAKEFVCSQLFKDCEKEVVPISLDEYIQESSLDSEEMAFLNEIKKINEKEQL